MSNLITEYRERLKINGIFPINEGYLFLNKDNLAIIALTSSFTKGMSACPHCGINAEAIILEVYGMNTSHILTKKITHTHMPADGDVLEYIKNHVPDGAKYKPYISSSDMDQERWLWESFLNNCVSENQIKKSEINAYKNFVEQMLYVYLQVKNGNTILQQFYDNIYSLSISRRYILVR